MNRCTFKSASSLLFRRFSSLHSLEQDCSPSESWASQPRSLPRLPVDLHNGRLFVREGNFALLVKAGFFEIADESAG
jgi:hypothetical protein